MKFNPRTHERYPMCNSFGMWDEIARKPPTRLQGVFVLYRLKRMAQDYKLGSYYYSTLEASRDLGYNSDVLGKLLRKTKGTEDEGIAAISFVTFITAKEAYERGVLRMFSLSMFPWLTEHKPRDSKIFLTYIRPQIFRDH